MCQHAHLFLVKCSTFKNGKTSKKGKHPRREREGKHPRRERVLDSSLMVSMGIITKCLIIKKKKKEDCLGITKFIIHKK